MIYLENGALLPKAQKDTWTRYRKSIKGKYSLVKRKSKYRGIPFNLSFKEYEDLIKDNHCHYCQDRLPESGIGLDRYDHALGYIIGNVVPCCTDCNVQKGYLEAAGFTLNRVIELMAELKAKGIRLNTNDWVKPWQKK